MAAPARDRWAQWLLERRDGGDPEQWEATLGFLVSVRDRVLTNAALSEGETLLDVGAGDGLIAFGDVSQALLDRSRALAEAAGVLDGCLSARPADGPLRVRGRFRGRGDDALGPDLRRGQKARLRGVPPRREAGGRLSIFEPINAFGRPDSPYLFSGLRHGAGPGPARSGPSTSASNLPTPTPC